MTIRVGLALCDKGVDNYALARVAGRGVPKFDFDAVELQLENWDNYGTYLGGIRLLDILSDDFINSGNDVLRQALREVKSKKFKSFHSPIWAGNISSLDDRVRRQAMETTLKSMDAAQVFGTDVFVLHPCRYEWYYWQQFPGRISHYMDLRKKTAEIFLENLNYLSEYYARNGFTFKMGIENLEFNQYPCTVSEINDLLGKSRDVWRRNVRGNDLGLVLDIQHLKHAKAVLEDNYDHQIQFMIPDEEKQDLMDYIHRPICRDYTEDHPVLNSIFRTQLEDVILIHLAGNNHRHATHDAILYDLRSFVFEKKHMDAHMLNMKQVLDIIHHSGYNGAIILEVMSTKELFDERFDEQARSVENVRNYLGFLNANH